MMLHKIQIMRYLHKNNSSYLIHGIQCAAFEKSDAKQCSLEFETFS